MGKFRRRRRREPNVRVSSQAKVTTIVDRIFHDSMITENHLTGRRNSLSELGSDSGSCSSGAVAEVAFERGRSSARLTPGTTMKKLLADELSKETESRRRSSSPSVIARLMGLDGLPYQQSSNKQRKKISDNCQHDDAGSAGFHRSGKLCDSRSRKGVKGKQENEDVYEVDESLNRVTRSNSSRGVVNPNPSDDEIAFIRQKFMDVKRFSTDENLRNSKEFHDALEVLDSNKDILLKFLQEPGSLFTKHLRDLHSAQSHCERIEKMRSTNTLKSNIDAIGRHSHGESSRKIDVSHSHRHWDSCYGDSYRRRDMDSEMWNLSVEGKEDDTFSSTRIVVLKPNLSKVQGTASPYFSPSPSHDRVSQVDLHNECSNVKHPGSKKRGKRSARYDSDVYESRSRESRELAKEITRNMRNKVGVDFFNVSSSRHKGYSADESSRDMSENDSSYDSEATFISSQASYNRSVRNKPSTSRCTDSSLSREAKRRLSERWQMTRRSQHCGASSKGSTLAQMLAIPDVEIRPQSPDAAGAQDECCRRYESTDRTGQLNSPSGISSRDGWKDGRIRSLSRSKSLAASSNHLERPKSSTRHGVLAAERSVRQRESGGRLTKDAINMSSKREDVSFSPSTNFCTKKFESSYPVTSEIISDMQEFDVRGMMTENLDPKDLSEVKAAISETSSCRDEKSLVLHTAVDKAHIDASESGDWHDNQGSGSKILTCVRSPDDCSTRGLPSVQQEQTMNFDVRGSSCLHYAATQPESPVSSKESEQPSPVSVFEAPFVEELSSGSENFERVSAELHGLRMQLQRLKLESEAYDEGPMLVSSDEDVEAPTELHNCSRFLPAGKDWESSYMVDVLTDSVLNRTDTDLFLATWHSPDCPISPWVFDDLEKKYGALEICFRAERKLLFDRINAGIIGISLQFVNLHPWVRPLRRNVCSQWWKDGWFNTELQKSLQTDGKEVTETARDAVILGDMRWMELGEHIDFIGRNIEGLLTDELVAELLPM